MENTVIEISRAFYEQIHNETIKAVVVRSNLAITINSRIEIVEFGHTYAEGGLTRIYYTGRKYFGIVTGISHQDYSGLREGYLLIGFKKD